MFALTPAARLEIKNRIAGRDAGSIVCQFLFEEEQSKSSQIESDGPGSQDLGPLQQLYEAVAPAVAELPLRLGVGIFHASQVPAEQIRDISGIQFQFDDYWLSELADYELDFRNGKFCIDRRRANLR